MKPGSPPKKPNLTLPPQSLTPQNVDDIKEVAMEKTCNIPQQFFKNDGPGGVIDADPKKLMCVGR